MNIISKSFLVIIFVVLGARMNAEFSACVFIPNGASDYEIVITDPVRIRIVHRWVVTKKVNDFKLGPKQRVAPLCLLEFKTNKDGAVDERFWVHETFGNYPGTVTRNELDELYEIAGFRGIAYYLRHNLPDEISVEKTSPRPALDFNVIYRINEEDVLKWMGEFRRRPNLDSFENYWHSPGLVILLGDGNHGDICAGFFSQIFRRNPDLMKGRLDSLRDVLYYKEGHLPYLRKMLLYADETLAKKVFRLIDDLEDNPMAADAPPSESIDKYPVLEESDVYFCLGWYCATADEQALRSVINAMTRSDDVKDSAYQIFLWFSQYDVKLLDVLKGIMPEANYAELISRADPKADSRAERADPRPAERPAERVKP